MPPTKRQSFRSNEDDELSENVTTVGGGSECFQSAPCTDTDFTKSQPVGCQEPTRVPAPATTTAATADPHRDEGGSVPVDEGDPVEEDDIGGARMHVPPPFIISKLPLAINYDVRTTCLHTTPKHIFVGDSSGVLSVFEHGSKSGTAPKKYTVGRGAVHTISTNAAGSFLVAADILGQLLIQNMNKDGDSYVTRFSSSPMTCVCMHPDYSIEKSSKAILLGFKDGLVACAPGRMFGKNFKRIYSHHGHVHAISFRKTLVAFACGDIIVMFDLITNTMLSQHTFIAPCDRRVNTCHIRWESDTSLFMAWGNTVARLDSKRRKCPRFTPFADSPSNRYRVRGVELLPTRDCILVLVDVYGADDDDGVVMRIIQMVSFHKEGCSAPQLVGGNVMHSIFPMPISSIMSSHVESDPAVDSDTTRKHYLLTPMGVFRCKYSETHLEDTVDYLLTKRRLRHAFLFARVTGTRRPLPPGDIGCIILSQHFARQEWRQAAELAEKICESEGIGAEVRLWDVVINKFDAMSRAHLLINKMPTSIHLPNYLYNIVLCSCLCHDLPSFVTFVHVFVHQCDHKALIQCTQAKFMEEVASGSWDATAIGKVLVWMYEEAGNEIAASEIRRLMS